MSRRSRHFHEQRRPGIYYSCSVRIVNAKLETNATVRARSAAIFACSFRIRLDADLLKNFISPVLSFVWAAAPEKSYGNYMSTFDYEASAELFTAQGRPGFRYQRFAQAAEAIRYAIEKLPPEVLTGSSLEVKDHRYNAAQIRALYESTRYPLTRKKLSL
jgi:hypothetical protein